MLAMQPHTERHGAFFQGIARVSNGFREEASVLAQARPFTSIAHDRVGSTAFSPCESNRQRSRAATSSTVATTVATSWGITKNSRLRRAETNIIMVFVTLNAEPTVAA